MEIKQGENKRSAMIKALFGLLGTALLYYIVFTNSPTILEILKSKTYLAPLTSMGIVLLASFIYGTSVGKLLKHTLEERLKSQQLREE